MNTGPLTRTLAGMLDELANGIVVRSGGGPFVAHLAYHLGKIRQIHKETRGPKEGTFP